MTKKEYKQCISEALCPEYNAMLSESLIEHTFSPEFKNKMDKLIRHRKKPYYSFVNTIGKRVAVIILTFVMISFTTVMSVGALRKPFQKFVINMFKTHSDIRSDPEDTEEYPKTIESIYDIPNGIEGYEKELLREDSIGRHVLYTKGNKFVDLIQDVVYVFSMNANTEGATIEHIDINGYDAIGWLNNLNCYNLLWNNGEYIIFILSNISKDELITIAKSVQKVE